MIDTITIIRGYHYDGRAYLTKDAGFFYALGKTVQQAGPRPAHPCRNLRGADRGPWAVGRIDAMG